MIDQSAPCLPIALKSHIRYHGKSKKKKKFHDTRRISREAECKKLEIACGCKDRTAHVLLVEKSSEKKRQKSEKKINSRDLYDYVKCVHTKHNCR